MTDAYNEQDVENVFQSEEYPPTTIPVRVEGVVRTDEMPTKTYYQSKILRTGANAEKVLSADPRRKSATLWGIVLGAGTETLCIGEDQSTAQSFMGAHLSLLTVPVRYDITTQGEVWARPCLINETGGTFTGYAISTDDMILGIIIEQLD